MRRSRIRVANAAIAGMLSGCVVDDVPDEVVSMCDDPAHFFQCTRPLNMAHRGGSRLAPENTLAAFEHATSLGVDVLEMDLRSSADGVVVAMHDDGVDRTTDGTGPVTGLTLADLKALDAGYRFSRDGGATFPHRGQGVSIPTLDEVLTAVDRGRGARAAGRP